MTKLILPKTRYVIAPEEFPLIFFGGPIRGAPPWHDEAASIISSLNDNLTLAIPIRKIADKHKPNLVYGLPEDNFPRQRAWELNYLHLASKKGAIMFWLPGEAEHRCEKSYGAMTRVELGQWMTRHNLDNSVRLVIGTDGHFSEIDTIRYDLSVYTPNLPIYSSLEETCRAAVDLATK
jgi:hypothetical protein